MFQTYTVMLIVSGALLVVVGSAVPGLSAGMRVLNAAIGVAFAGYGLYLAFVFDGGTYHIFFYAFFLPVLLLVNAFRSWGARRSANAAPPGYPVAPGYAAAPPPYPAPPAGYPAPQPGYPQPQYGQPAYGYPQPAPGYPAPGTQAAPGYQAPGYPTPGAFGPAPSSAPPAPSNGANNHAPRFPGS
jgi:hypothetical protein